MPTIKANSVGTIVHKIWLHGFVSQDKKKKKKEKHNGLRNSPIEKKKIYYFLKEGTFFSWY